MTTLLKTWLHQSIYVYISISINSWVCVCVCERVRRIKNTRLLFNKDLNNLEVEMFRLVFVAHVLHVEGTFVAQLQALHLQMQCLS